MDDGKSYGFTITDVGRLKKLLTWFEKHYRNSPPKAEVGARAGWQGPMPVTITSSVTAGSLASPSTFTFTFLVPSGSTALTATGGLASQTGYNAAAGVSFASGKYGTVYQFNNNWYLLAADC